MADLRRVPLYPASEVPTKDSLPASVASGVSGDARRIPLYPPSEVLANASIPAAPLTGILGDTRRIPLVGPTEAPTISTLLGTDVAAGGVVLPTLAPTTASFTAGATSGSLITAITGLSSGETISSVSPNDGRVAISSGSALVVGLTASAAGTISYTLTTSTGRTLTIAVTANAVPSLTANPPNPSITTAAATGSTVFALGGVLQGVTPTIPANSGLVIGGDATNGWKVVVGANPLTAGTINAVVSSQGQPDLNVSVVVAAANAVPQLVNPPVAMIAGSVGRLASHPYGVSQPNIAQQWGGMMTPLMYLEPRINCVTYRVPDPYANAKGIGGLVYANDGAGMDTYESWIPRIKAAAEAATAAGTKLIVIYLMTNNSYTLVNSATDFAAYTAQAKQQIQRLIGYGCIVIVAGCSPRGSQTVNPFTGTGAGAPRYAYKAINAEMKAYADARPTTMGFFDQASVLLDNDNLPNDPLPNTMRTDQTHPTTYGSYLLAKLAKAEIGRFLAPASTARANRGTGSNLVPDFSAANPITVTGVPNASGIIPAGWKVVRNGGTDTTLVFDIVTVNGVPKLKFTATGTPTTNESFVLSPITAPALTINTWYKGFMNVELSAYSRWNEFGTVYMNDASNKVWSGNISVGNDGSPNPLAAVTIPSEAINLGARTADGQAASTGAGAYSVTVGWGVGTGTISGFLSQPEARAQIDPRFLTFDSTITAPVAITSSPTITMDELAIVSVQVTANKPAFFTVDAPASSAGISVGLTNGVLRGGSNVQSQPVSITAQPYDFRDANVVQSATYNVTANPNVFTDNFNRPDGLLNGGWTDGPVEGTGGVGFLISNEKLATVTSGSDNVYTKIAPKKGDTNRLRMSYSRLISASNAFAKLYLCSDGTDQNGLYIRHNVANTITLTRVIGGVGANVGTFTTDVSTPAAFMLEVDGARTVSAYQNGAKIGTITLDADIPAEWKRSLIRYNGSGVTSIDNWASTTSDLFAIKDKIILKSITAASTTLNVTQSAGVEVNLNNTTFGASLNIKSVTANTGDWNADGVVLRATNMPVGTYTVTVVLTEAAPNAANSGAARDSTLTFNVTVTAG